MNRKDLFLFPWELPCKPDCGMCRPIMWLWWYIAAKVAFLTTFGSITYLLIKLGAYK